MLVVDLNLDALDQVSSTSTYSVVEYLLAMKVRLPANIQQRYGSFQHALVVLDQSTGGKQPVVMEELGATTAAISEKR
jgi:hypothetical protein